VKHHKALVLCVAIYAGILIYLQLFLSHAGSHVTKNLQTLFFLLCG